MKKRCCLLLTLAVLLFAFSGCREDTRKPQEQELQSVEQVGEVPEALRQAVAEDTFNGATAFADRFLKYETSVTDRENRIVTHRVWMMDRYGKTLAEYTCTTDAAYSVEALTATEDGGFLFVLGFSEYYVSEELGWASEAGFASRVIKCGREGNVQFDTPLDSVEGYALRYCFEKDGSFYFFGTIQTPETRVLGVGSRTDIYMTILDSTGAVRRREVIAGSDYDMLYAAEPWGDGFLLSIRAQSGDGDFAGFESDGYPEDWVFVVDAELQITDRKQETGRKNLYDRIGEQNGAPVYLSDAFLEDFDGGAPTAYMDYGDFYLIVSDNRTGVYENQPAYFNSSWYYWETVYSGYDNNGNLLFRASVDSSPDYDGMVESMNSESSTGS